MEARGTGGNEDTRLDDLVTRLDRLEAENDELRERLDGGRRERLSRRALLGGDYNEGTQPTILKGTIGPGRVGEAGDSADVIVDVMGFYR